MPRFDVVVSAENNAYLVWQAMLFHASCMERLGRAPIVMVHGDLDRPLLDGFQRIVDTGGVVQRAPNYRRWNGVNYPPRNTPASLRHLISDADYLVLCDCDFVFLKPLPWDELAVGPREITFDSVPYLHPDGEHFQPRLDEACRRAGLDPALLRRSPISGGVPHVIPRALQQELADDWLYCTDLFPAIGPWDASTARVRSTECHLGEQREWLASMWGLVFAVHRLGLTPRLTRLAVLNAPGHPLPPPGPHGPSLIHYCYGDDGFEKRRYDDEDAARRRVWRQPPDDGGMAGAIRAQLLAARKFYRLDDDDEGSKG